MLTDRFPRVLPFAVLLGWCAGLIALRAVHSGRLSFGFLVWNLALAAVPLLASVALARADRRGEPVPVRLGWFVLWLCFLPNAPYLVTDFIHLRVRPPVPLWFDAALFVSYAGTGLLMGYASVADVQALVERRRGWTLGWAAATAALLLSAFGVYLGRFLRWNSWDALLHPWAVATEIARMLANLDQHPRLVAVTLVYGSGLLLGYVALRGLARGRFVSADAHDASAR